MDRETILEAKDIRKQFPGVIALDKVNFNLKKGEVHAIVGENGAGKSTLMHILGGLYQKDEGEIYLDGKEVNFSNTLDANKNGISIVFQELSMIQELSVAENIFANRQPVNGINMIKYGNLYKQTKKLLETFNEDIDPRKPIKYLSIAKQQVVEILKAISNNPKVLILDEPTSSLTKYEIEKLFENIRILSQQGIGIIYISHHLQEIFEIADRATVLRDGKYVDTVNVSETDEDHIVSMMVGREVSHEYIPRQDKIDKDSILLKVEGLTHKKLFKDISFELYKGEIIGFAGLVGSGRTEMAKAIFGLDKIESGKIYLNNKQLEINSPKDAMDHGIVYTSENRKEEGLFLSMNVKENCIVTQLKRFVKKASIFLDNKQINEYAKKTVEKFNIITPSIKQYVRNLSGGNQQKVLLSMWLGRKPDVVIVDEPTKGVDVGAKSEIYEMLRKLADTGVGIIIISSDLLEILTISDRIVVMKNGSIAGTLNNDEADEENIIAYATGVEI